MEPKIRPSQNADNAEKILSQSSSLTHKNLTQVIIDLDEAIKAEKKAEKIKKELRGHLFHVATLENEKKVLPRKTIRLGVGFLNSIGMQENHFLASRFPGWNKVASRKVNDKGEQAQNGTWIEYLLERDPAILPWSIEVEKGDGSSLSAGRSIQQKSPELDQRSLQKDMPEVFDKIMNPKVIYEVDVAKLEALIAAKPDLLPQLELHFSYPEPVSKLSSIKETPPDGG